MFHLVAREVWKVASGSDSSRKPIIGTIGAIRVFKPSAEYADVTGMFCYLKSLDQESVAFRRQRDAIIRRCLPLADHIAQRYGGRGEPLDDLIQTARVGLVNAVNRYDVSYGADFPSFAVPTIMGEIRRYFRDFGWAVKVPRRCKDLQPQVAKARDELTQRLGRAPNASDIAKHLGIERDLVVDAIVASSNYFTRSTDAPARADDDQYRSVADTMGDVDPGMDKVLAVETARLLIAALPQRQRTVLTLRFFEDMTQTQIAERMGISQMHVSRLLAKALATVRCQAHKPDFAAAG
jgi:RNA polymerase sigma-B factor